MRHTMKKINIHQLLEPSSLCAVEMAARSWKEEFCESDTTRSNRRTEPKHRDRRTALYVHAAQANVDRGWKKSRVEAKPREQAN